VSIGKISGHAHAANPFDQKSGEVPIIRAERHPKIRARPCFPEVPGTEISARLRRNIPEERSPVTTPTQPSVVKPASPGVPRRAILGALLVSASLGAAAALGIAGAALRPAQEDFFFSRGTSFASGEAARLKARAADLAVDDRIILRITGHSGTQGDEAANLALSEERAEAARTIALAAGFPLRRIDWTGGVGGGAPLSRDADQSDRAYQTGLARVTLSWQVRP